MNVYVESNFVLELALMQEQYESCSQLDSKDFSNPTIIDELNSYNCRLLFRFDDGLGYIQSQI
ncbi:hypothetical protein H6G20_19670 [Desertifilum sp. FACHB-1129]|uniref:Uncharacterized protein n=1 Tax=Desertifilum tharense IPPAS B-1220 TaxID=1781255 RepID=A0A1E5QD20_9CYAN|nr:MULTISPECIES: hypothetical protein [Desertifilum]MBD2313891.1 hypothetical protein [Desertifilum sp. FACHB-1129]MBD2324722.1 hypothetical protein [Desertifilum sp. FACHB-866]MBD2334884.1 hypothetical protein [Desertifilum sp. FACHB-868]OEJ72484.1 hypothetical protein BH720_24740 [Desertifilum tharense IPPAS B-1220]